MKKPLVVNVVVACCKNGQGCKTVAKTIKTSYKYIGCIFENFFLCEMS